MKSGTKFVGKLCLCAAFFSTNTVKLLDLSGYNKATKIYWAGLICTGLPLIVWAVYGCASLTAAQLVLLTMFALLIVAVGLFSIRLPNTLAGVTASDVVVFLAVIYVGVPAAVLLGAFDSFICGYRLTKIKKAWINSAAVGAIGAWITGQVFYLTLYFCGISVSAPLSLQPIETSSLVIVLSVTGLFHFLGNNFSIALFLALKNEQNVFRLFVSDFLSASWGSLAGALASGIIYKSFIGGNWVAALFSLPIILLPFIAYRIYFRRIEEKTQEAVEASRLYMSAIEALSNAIEAREQITPGHVRRVQIYAVELARAVNLPSDEVKALELAALLHGIGKLAVPDYILNKPSQLSASEKERVQLHPLIGAEIVESVNFPYPVTTAVRYYNEAWDGYGYPDGLRGEEIPITARILGIADAYDTMREERPFRAACTREDARRMLLAGAGTRFDPGLVSIFLRHLAQFEGKITAAGLPLDGATVIVTESGTRMSLVPHYLEQIRQTNREVFALYELARLSSASLSMDDLLPFLCKKVQELVPCETCVIYLYDKLREKAKAEYAVGKNAAFLRDREVAVGEGVIGFVLKNGKRVGSVNPTLDFTGDYTIIAQEYSTMAVLPLQTGEYLVGALAVYSEKLHGYDEEHLRLLEATSHVAAEAIARTIQHAESENRAMTDPLTGLPNARSLQIQLEKEVSRSKRSGRPFQFIMFDLDNFKQVNDTFGHRVGDVMLCEIAKILRGQLRDYDFLARYAGDEFVAIVPELSDERVQELCERIERVVTNFALPVDGKRVARVGISVGAAAYPQHGESLDQIMVAADQNMYLVKAIHRRESGSLRTPENAEIVLQSVN